MHEKLMTFDEFRTSQADVLHRQREHLRDDQVADGLLRDGIGLADWTPWSDSVQLG